MAAFQNPANGHVERVIWTSSACVFMFGGLYLAFKGLWSHVLIWLVLGLGLSFAVGVPIPALIVDFIYMFAIQGILSKNYLHKGWAQVRDEPQSAAERQRYQWAKDAPPPAGIRSPTAVIGDATSSPVRTLAQSKPKIADAAWASALAEVDGPDRIPALWGRVFAEAEGVESKAKAAYIAERAKQLSATI